MKPSYNREGCKNLSFDRFKNLHKEIDYFKYLTDAQWEAEYATATGHTVKYEQTTTEVKKKAPKKEGV